MARRATLRDVAHAADVSVAAASFALRGMAGVSDATRDRVLSAAERLQYSPNRTARSLRTARHDAIGLLLPRGATRATYYAEVAFGVVDAADAAGRSVILLPHAPASPEPAPFVDGFIVVDAAAADPLVQAILDDARPLVSGERVEGLDAPVSGSVLSDHQSAMRGLLEHVAAQGARRIAAILPPRGTAWGREVGDAYDAWCVARGHGPRSREVAFVPAPGEVIAATAELLSDDVDGLVAVPSGSAAPAMTAAAAAGRTPGADLLLAAYIDEPVLAMLAPSVTALDLQGRLLGRSCVELLLAALDDPTGAVAERIIEPRLLERSSTAEH